jgi:GT2 family glycosyltransferase
MKKVAVVTVNYNTEKDTHKLLESLKTLKTSDISLLTIVVDNGSDNKLVLKETEDLLLIRSEENLGFTGGYNVGMRRALTLEVDYILILNNDTVVDADLLKNMLAVMESDKTIGVTVPKIYFAKGHEFHKDRYKKEELGKVFWYAGGYTDWENVQSVHRGVDEVDKGQYDTSESVDFVTGCCMLFRREVLKKVGLFDEKYFLYFEDADLNERIKKAGYVMQYIPTAVLYHANASSTGGAGSNLQDYFMTRNQMLFGMKYAPLRAKIALIRQSAKLLRSGRPKQKQGIRDYYLGKFGKGTFFDKK